MGNLLGKHEQQLTDSLNREYQVESHSHLLHRATNQLCTLHKITTNSQAETLLVMHIIEEYQLSKCESISKLQAYYRLERRGYCSDEETFYLIFRGQNTFTLKEEFVKRRFYRQGFRQEEIQQIVESYLCGLREYAQRFQRQYEKMTLDCIVIEQFNKRIHLRDPWLNVQPEKQASDNLSSIMQSYPSPQKLNAALSPKMETFNSFLSNLFSIGVICLQLKRLDFADGIYSKKRQIQYEQIGIRLKQFRDQKLKRGIQFLLNPDPIARKQVYSVWGIENRQQHYLVPFDEGIVTSRIQNNIQAPLEVKQIDSRKQNLHMMPSIKKSQLNTIQAQSHYIPNLPSDSMHTSRTGPTINIINTARTSSETNRVNIPTNLSNQTIHFNGINRQSQQKPPHLLPMSNTPIITIPPNPLIKQEPMSWRNQKGSNYFSFKEYTHNFQTQNHNKVVTSFPNTIVNFKKQQSPPKSILFSQEYVQKIGEFSGANINKQIKNEMHVFGPVKESFTFYEQPQNYMVQDKIVLKQEDSRIKNKQVQNQPKQQSNKKINKNSAQTPQITQFVEEKAKNTNEDSSPSKKNEQKIQKASEKKNPEAISLSVNVVSSSQELLIKKQETQTEKIATPQRPVTNHKYNSTIVQVKDEDTPDHSAKSEDVIEEEYVVEQYQTGSRYEGFKSGGMRNGRGRFYYQDGGYYEGQWKNNKMDGFGKLYYEGGKLAYEGQWSQDEFNGLGKVYNDNPVTFKGSFDYTNFDFLEDYWEYYEGMLVKDTKEGRGKIKLSNGEVFQGDFHQDKIQGFGKFLTLHRKVVEGIWRQSKLIKVINSN